jgi:hypothetical protein
LRHIARSHTFFAMGNSARMAGSAGTGHDEESAGLQAEIDRLHRYIRRQWAAVAAAQLAEDATSDPDRVPPGPISPSAQARAVMRKAQEVADRRLAETGPHITRHPRQDAGRLLLLAPARYGDIVMRAHQRAGSAAEAALDDLSGLGGLDGVGGVSGQGGAGGVSGVSGAVPRVRAELEMKAAYLRTFAKVSRAALQGELEMTAREFDDLLGNHH